MTELANMFAARFSREEMIDKVNESHSSFLECLKIALSDQEPQGWRAAWILGHCTKKNDLRLPVHTDSLIEAIQSKKDGHQRELLKLIFKIHLNDEQEGKVFDQCVTIWETIGKSPSVRYFAFNFIFEIVKKYPDLKGEIDFLTQQEYLDALSPGVRRGIEKKIMKLNS
ncbi:MAG: hypothetical protein JXR03_00465 [Cyclobacteriaceae bacterium]